MTLVLIDADPIVYRCGFASEKTNWHIVYETYEGQVREAEFVSDENGTATSYLEDWLAYTHGLTTILDKSKVVVPDPLSFALRAVKTQVESIMTEIENKYKEGCKMLMWLSGGKNYRDKIARVRPYKGNRDPLHKPVHYQAIRDYLQAQYGSFMTDGIEADDAVSIFANDHYERRKPERLVIATIDKDLDQIPGLHYNFMQQVHYAISPEEAEKFFVYQIVAGDATDNVIGVWRCGPTAATEFAERVFRYFGCGNEEGAGGMGEIGRSRAVDAWWPAVVSKYADSQRKANCPYAGDNPEAIALEMAQLVHLQQYPGQLWTPHGDLVVQGFGEENSDVE